jgi:hypothetical protein
MKTRLILLVVLVAALTACRDKEAEKKIAALEARLSEMEAKRTVPSQNPSQVQPAAPEQKPEGPLPVIAFEAMDHDFGTINEGDVVEYTYKFKNTGEAPLIIQNAQPSCGCTVPEWSKDPIPVGGEGYIKAKFDSKGKPNMQNKSITVTANTFPKQNQLKFKAMVMPGATTPPAKATN